MALSALVKASVCPSGLNTATTLVMAVSYQPSAFSAVLKHCERVSHMSKETVQDLNSVRACALVGCEPLGLDAGRRVLDDGAAKLLLVRRLGIGEGDPCRRWALSLAFIS